MVLVSETALLWKIHSVSLSYKSLENCSSYKLLEFARVKNLKALLVLLGLSPHCSLSWPDLPWPQNKEQIWERASAQNSSCLACSPCLWAELRLGIVIESRAFVCSLLAISLLLTIWYHDKESSVSKAEQPKLYWREGKGNRKQFKEYELEAGKKENLGVIERKVKTKKIGMN